MMRNILLFLVLFAFCAKASAATLRVIGLGEIGAIQPYGAEDYLSQFARGLISRPITSFSEDWNLQCLLCGALPVAADRGSETVGEQNLPFVIWRLLPGVKWGDGSDLLAEDIVETVRLLKAGLIPVSESHPVWALAKVVAIPDKPLEFKMYWRHHAAKNDDLSWLYPLPKSLVAAIDNPQGTLTYLSPEFWRPEVFRKISLTHLSLRSNNNSTFVFERAAKSGQSSDGIDTIELQVLPQQTTSLPDALKQQKIHLILGAAPGSPASQWKGWLSPGMSPVEAVVNIMDVLVFNTRNPALTTRTQRESIAKGLQSQNLQKIKQDFWFEPSSSWLHPQDQRLKSLVLKAEDGEAADKDAATGDVSADQLPKLEKETLTQPGSTAAGTAAAGATVAKKLQIRFAKEPNLREAIALELAKGWNLNHQQIGVEGEDAGKFFGETLKKITFPDLALFAVQMEPWHTFMGLFHSAQIPSLANGYVGQNFSAFSRLYFDGLLDQQARAQDQQDFLAAQRKLIEQVSQEYVYLPLGFRRRVVLVNAKLQGFALHPMDLPASFGLNLWRLSP